MNDKAKSKRSPSSHDARVHHGGNNHNSLLSGVSPGQAGGFLSSIQKKVVVGKPHDAYEREADRVADFVSNGRGGTLPSISRIDSRGFGAHVPASSSSSVQTTMAEEEPTQTMTFQREAEDEKEESAQTKAVQRQEEEKEETAQRLAIQRQEEEEKEPVQTLAIQRQEEEEEPAQTLVIQRQAEEEEEPTQTAVVQRQDEKDEEPAQTLAIQRQEEEEEPAQSKVVQRQEEEEEQAQTLVIQRQEEKEEPTQTLAIQRQAKEEEEPAQTAVVQRQDEKEEESAQTLAIQRQEEEEEPAHALAIQDQAEKEEESAQTAAVQRQEEKEESLQSKSEGSGTTPSSRAAAGQAIHHSGAGRPLNSGTRRQLESGMGVDLSDVRVHDDGQARNASAALKARAFTHKNHIWLGRGESADDTRLLAHEATHVLQQDGIVRRKPKSDSGNGKPSIQRQVSEPLEATEEPKSIGTVEDEASTTPLITAPTPETAPMEAVSETMTPAPTTVPEAAKEALPETAAQTTKMEEKKAEEGASLQGGAPAPEAAAESTAPPAATTETGGPAPATAEGGAETAAAPAEESTTAAEEAVGKTTTTVAAGAEETAPLAAATPETAAAEAAEAEQLQGALERLNSAARLQEGSAASANTQRQASRGASLQASAAAPSPGNEAQAMGQAGQVDTMNAQEAGEVQQQSFLELVRQKLRELEMPANPQEMEDFNKRGGAAGLQHDLRGAASQQTAHAQGAIRSATEGEPTPASERVPEELPRGEQPGPVPDLQTREALPDARSSERVERPLEQSSDEVEEKLAEENLTQERLEKANDPRFTAVQEAREEVHEHAENAPQQYREEEQTLLAEQESAMAEEETAAARDMERQQQQSRSQITEQQRSQMSDEERQRQEVSDNIQAIYTRTQGSVQDKLNWLDEEFERRFTEGEAKAREKFEEFVDNEFSAWKWRRYGGRAAIPVVGGLVAAGTWVADQFRDINEFPEVKQIYVDGKNLYLSELDAVIVDIAGLVDETLAWCKEEISRGQGEIQDYVKNLPDDLRQTGRQSANRVSEQFDELREGVEERKNALADQLVERYQQSVQELDQRIEELQAENRGLVARFMETLNEIIEAIRAFRERLMSIIAEARDTIELILQDPIGFLENLLDALKMGFNQFVANIWEHLKRGLLGWLFGSLAAAGITMPSDFSIKSVVGLILQILGLTWDRIRPKLVRLVGERNMAILEKVFEYVSTLFREGPAGLWELIKEDLSNLKDFVLNAIKEWVISRIIQAAVTKLISMLNPVGAIVQAILAIYNTVMFFIERIQQILDLVQSIVQSLGAIVRGQLTAAANRVEQTLGLTIPLIISFLARLLGIGGIAKKIQEIIKKVRRRVDRAVNKALKKVVSRIKRLFGRGRRETRPEPSEATGGYIYEETQGSHTIKISKDLKVFRFTAPTQVTGNAAQTVEQKALEKIVPRQTPHYPTDSLDRATGPSGHAPRLKEGESRESLPATRKLPGGAAAYQPGDHRGHLIGDRFGGVASGGNLVPMHPTLNLSTFKSYENTLASEYKNLDDANKPVLLYMNIIPRYPKSDANDPDSYRPTSISANSKVITLKSNANQLQKDEKSFSDSFSNPDSGVRRQPAVNLNTASAEDIATLPGIGPVLAARIVSEREARGLAFGRYSSLEAIEGLGPEKIRMMRSDPNKPVTL